ncbi:DUF3597 domain-containing protein [Pseudomonas fluorescens]|uniref:DUF3597 domain-containing protein n=1 Tax=Pseudomonas fluorescens TaxID=294 RepID=A0A5E7DZB8_PSEFL|nr:DUF3597 domain-containing protein [Pseudomonas fluorescens]VVO13862.1 hypothetical protein PS833_03648 [Pseudomonas fluorescens]
MSLFSTILEKLGIGKHAASTAEAAPATPAAGASPAAPQTSTTTPTAAISEVDVAAKLEALASQQGGQLNWRTSIVDLLKLLNIDSSLDARKKLAAELHYTGSTDDSAAMNIWLHSAVMKKLAENGGKVPADLLN